MEDPLFVDDQLLISIAAANPCINHPLGRKAIISSPFIGEIIGRAARARGRLESRHLRAPSTTVHYHIDLLRQFIRCNPVQSESRSNCHRSVIHCLHGNIEWLVTKGFKLTETIGKQRTLRWVDVPWKSESLLSKQRFQSWVYFWNPRRGISVASPGEDRGLNLDIWMV